MRSDINLITIHMKEYFGYVRVSTAKQEAGASLQAQREAIAKYAASHSLAICRWFEEIETAAKSGRPLFADMMRQLHRGQAAGVLIHKIDRSARNFRDWAHIGELADKGIEVRFVTETLDFRSRGGRLSADIQAVIAADYIRNLREETIKGLYGRLAQGIYPFPAPIGYLDQGRGRPKIPDPERAPLITEAFSLYASGEHSLESLAAALFALGLRSRADRRIPRNVVAVLLHNPFYAGTIRIRRTGATYPGIHQALVSPALFDRVQQVLLSRAAKKHVRHDHRYRGLFRCGLCRSSLTPESQKSHVYYRCHTKTCPTKCTHESLIDAAVSKALGVVVLSEQHQATVRQELTEWFVRRPQTSRRNSLRLQLGRLSRRRELTMNALISGFIRPEEHRTRVHGLDLEYERLTQALGQASDTGARADLDRFLAVTGDITTLYGCMTTAEQRELLRLATAERAVRDRAVTMATTPPEHFLEPYASLLKRMFHRLAVS